MIFMHMYRHKHNCKRIYFLEVCNNHILFQSNFPHLPNWLDSGSLMTSLCLLSLDFSCENIHFPHSVSCFYLLVFSSLLSETL